MAEAHEVDVWERTKGYGGQPVQAMNRRLFMQLLVLECEGGVSPAGALEALKLPLAEHQAAAVIYEDVTNPRGLAVLSFSEDPSDFVTKVRPALNHPSLAGLRVQTPLTMFGRSYSTGYESDLNFWLLDRPRQTVINPAWPWAVWYPLRRSGAFEQLEDREKGSILREHGDIGQSYGKQDLAHDVRLACHGLDAKDNEFVIGLIGKELHPLSHVVQAMRKTRQTSQYIAQMGPFFVGYRVWQSPAATR